MKDISIAKIKEKNKDVMGLWWVASVNTDIAEKLDVDMFPAENAVKAQKESR